MSIIKKAFRYLRNPYVVTVALIAVGAALRIWPLDILETRVAWLTYYPTVMVAAVYGGFLAGLAGALLASLIVVFLWPVFVAQPFIQTFADWLGLAVFCLNCALISYIAELMRRARTKARRAQEEAEAANKAKSIFLANMSHELRTPLNAILGFSRILSNAGDISSEQKANLRIITRSGEHLLNLINNILDISKIESGKIVLEEAETDLHYLLKDCHSSMNCLAIEKGLDLIIERSLDVPRFITVDQVKLRQVLINLIGNALKFTERGRVIIRATVVQQEIAQRICLRFEVDDTGPGIRMEDREKMFLPFVQVGGQNSKESGTGLGLTISKQNIELMGGRIGVDSEFGKGSLFYFEIPAMLPAVAGTSIVPQDRRVTGLADGQPHFRLLIVEDQPDSRLLLRKLLEPLAFHLREAVNGQEAVNVFHEWHPDLIWMDIRMPVMDGMEATRIIKRTEFGAHTKIIALTAHALSEERLEILAAGCDDFIRKPYRETEIFQALAKHLGVKFMYAGEQAAVSEHFSGQDLAELSCLHPALIRDLTKAVESLDGQFCHTVIGQIGDRSPGLSEHLHRMVENMQYQELLSTLDKLNKKVDA
jgi:signal transduction histidine kinase/CheY-like chemotaxis protein